jgi:hypothetical protein
MKGSSSTVMTDSRGGGVGGQPKSGNSALEGTGPRTTGSDSGLAGPMAVRAGAAAPEQRPSIGSVVGPRLPKIDHSRGIKSGLAGAKRMGRASPFTGGACADQIRWQKV